MTLDDLTTLATAKAYVGVSDTSKDAVISGLITRISGQIRTWLNRSSLRSQTYRKLFNGTGTNRLILPDWPVTEISSLVIGNRAIEPAPDPSPSSQQVVRPSTTFGSGFRFQQWDGVPPGAQTMIELLGGRFPLRNDLGVLVTYTAGYRASEDWTVPSPEAGGLPTITPNQGFGFFVQDAGVSYADGTAFTSVATMPTKGQYTAPAPMAAAPLYTFSADDVGQQIVLRYSYVPVALEQACLDAVFTVFSPLSLGVPSNIVTLKAGVSEMQFSPLGFGPGNTTVFLTASITAALGPFQRVVPF